VKRWLGIVVGIYLLVGVAFAAAEVSERVWVCPDPTAPHGVTTGSERKSPECETMHGVGEQVAAFVVLTVAWGPLLCARGLANVRGG
jgi:hypothetical protein